MYTVLLVISNNSVVSWECEYFNTLAEAEAYTPIGQNCEVEKCAIVEGKMSEDEAEDYLFD